VDGVAHPAAPAQRQPVHDRLPEDTYASSKSAPVTIGGWTTLLNHSHLLVAFQHIRDVLDVDQHLILTLFNIREPGIAG
jgi:hypothetical protein